MFALHRILQEILRAARDGGEGEVISMVLYSTEGIGGNEMSRKINFLRELTCKMN